jgi:PP-loop superfamily ATP-utilizing enzyme
MVNDNFQVREKGTRGSVALHEVLPSEPSTASVKKKRISRRLVKVRKGEVTRRLRAFSFPSGPQIVTA